MASANGILIQTANGWLRRAEDMPRKRGGYLKPKLTEEHIERLVAYVGENHVITLSKMRSKLELEFGIQICILVWNTKFYTVKKILLDLQQLILKSTKKKGKLTCKL